MKYQIGDRVEAVVSDFPGLFKGELGTIVGFDSYECPIVNWDEYIKDRHDSDGLVLDGHGWFVTEKYIRPVSPDDFGEFICGDEESVTKFLFDK